ncbi:MAG: hypothetical protein ICV59_05250 [Thermoleophilia bacterium]|nr:hypothetical protein [Thermoleophilia bacterium]
MEDERTETAATEAEAEDTTDVEAHGLTGDEGDDERARRRRVAEDDSSNDEFGRRRR